MLVLLAALSAVAHPFGASTAAHRADLLVDGDEVRLRYTAEVPLAVIRAHALRRPGADPVAATTTALVGGLRLTLDGAPVPLVVQGPATVRPSDDARAIGLTLRAALPDTPGALKLSIDELPGATSRWWWTVHVGPALEVVDTTLVDADRRPLTDRWLADEPGGSASLRLRPLGAAARFTRWLRGEPASPRPVDEAFPEPGADFRSGRLGPLGLAIAAALALGFGATARARGPAALPLLVGLAAAALPLPALAGIELALATLALIASARPAHGVWLGACAVAATVHGARLAVVLAAVALLGTTARARLPDALAVQLGRSLLWVAAGWVLLRGLSGWP